MSLNTLQKVVLALGVAVGVALTGALAEVTWHSSVVLLVKLLIVALSALIAGYAGDRLAVRASVRRRLGGHEWIDGTWINVVRSADGRVLRVGIVQFVPDGTGVRYGGRNFDPATGELDGSFDTMACTYDYPEVYFVYSSVSRADGAAHELGGGVLRLVATADGSPPDRFTAWCDGAVQGSAHTIEGARVFNGADLSRLRDRGGRGAIDLAVEFGLTPPAIAADARCNANADSGPADATPPVDAQISSDESPG